MTKRLKVDLNNIFEQDIDLIVDYLKNDKIVVLPTDTVYGFSCLATSKKAISKIYKIKKREKNKKFLILIKGYCMLKDYCVVSKRQEQYLRTVWPRTTREAGTNEGVKIKKPVTAILKTKNILPQELKGEDGSLAVRLPKSVFLSKILRGVNVPLVSTSLNISGQESLDIDDLDKVFKKDKPDLVVEAVGVKKNKPSSIVDIRDLDNIKIVRK